MSGRVGGLPLNTRDKMRCVLLLKSLGTSEEEVAAALGATVEVIRRYERVAILTHHQFRMPFPPQTHPWVHRRAHELDITAEMPSEEQPPEQ